MNNVEKLRGVGRLGDIRQRLGAKDGADESRDERINGMSPIELVGSWTGWTLGDEYWGRAVVRMYQALC